MTAEEAIDRLEQMQSQIIDGTDVFGQIADVIRIQTQFIDGVTTESRVPEPLRNPSAHDLASLFRALKFGRPGGQQRFLLRLAELIEQRGTGEKELGEVEDGLGDPADWWKKE